MNFIKKGIGALLVVSLLVAVSCTKVEEPNPTGLSAITLSSINASASGDGTIVTVSPVSVGATSVEVDFGDPTSEEDVLVIEQGGSATYDYPNELPVETYTLTVTARSDQGLTAVTKTEDIEVVHTPDASISTAPASPTGRISNVFALFTDGLDWDGGFLEYRWGEPASGGSAVAVDDNNLIQLSRLGIAAQSLTVKTITPSEAFGVGIAATHIHLDVHSNFAEGVDVLKVTIENEGATEEYVVDGLSLTDGEWVSFDFDLAADFSASVSAIDKISFEVGTGGTANDHASIYVDNIYLYKETGATILNGDFEITSTYATSQWRFTTFTDGESNPFGSSSDGSNFDYSGVNTGSKTRGAKWSSSQSGGQLASPSSRYAYQALKLTPDTDYVLEYQYAIDDDNEEIVGGRHLVGLVLDGYYIDGADAVDDVNSNIGYYQGFYAEGKFNSTPNGYGTFAQVPFTSNAEGEVSVMFYSVAPDDAWIDNVKVVEAVNATTPTASFDAEENSANHLEYTFVNTSLNGASFIWDFGDGTTSTEKSPTHAYAANGNYTVELTATNVAGSAMSSEVISVSPPGVVATFPAVLQNADFETYPTAENNTNDLVDAWTIDPDNTFNDGSDSPFDWWRNDALEGWVSDPTNNGGAGTTDKGSSSGTDAGGPSGRSLKFDSSGERAYQPFEVEEGVEYTITANVKSETTPVTDVEGTFYILGAEPADETDLASIAITTVPVTATAINTWQEVSFSFTVNSTFTYPQSRVDESVTDGGILTSTTQKFVLFYFVPTNTVTTDNEVFITDVVISTPGF